MNDRPPAGREPHIALVTGPIGSGKTTVTGRVVDRARQRRRSVAGLWCPARIEGGVKVGIEAVDLARHERRLLALRTDAGGGRAPAAARPGPQTGRYRFDPAVMEWANQVLAAAVEGRPDLLVVDEIGPLELERDEGLSPVLAGLASGAVPRALVVVRDRLQAELAARLGRTRIYPFLVVPGHRDPLPGRILAWLFPASGME